MKKIYSVILLLAVMLSSCTKDETDIMTDDNSNAPALAKTRSDGSDMVEYELLPNPYTVDVIQGVLQVVILRITDFASLGFLPLRSQHRHPLLFSGFSLSYSKLCLLCFQI